MKYRIKSNQSSEHNVVGFKPYNALRIGENVVTFTVDVVDMDNDYFEEQLKRDDRVVSFKMIKQ